MRKYESGFSYAPEEIKKEYFETNEGWDNFMEDLSTASKKVKSRQYGHFTPQFLDTHTQNYDVQHAFKAMSERRELYKKTKIEQTEGSVRIMTNMPITIIPMGDMHLGSVYFNQKLFNQHINTILKTPGVYTMFLGNEVDNDIKFENNNMPNSIPPMEQFRVMQSIIKKLDSKNKMLSAVVSDCHQGWSWAKAGIDGHELLYGYKGRKFPVIENGGILHLDVGKGRRNIQNAQRQEYAIGMYHKQGPFNSRFNPEHALRQNRRLYHEGYTDVEIGAHHHVSAASASYEGAKGRQRPVHWLRVGTYKGVPTNDEIDFVTDKWISDRAGVSGQKPGVALHVWNNRHKLDDSIDFETAIEKHLAIRTLALVREMGLEDRFNKLMK